MERKEVIRLLVGISKGSNCSDITEWHIGSCTDCSINDLGLNFYECSKRSGEAAKKALAEYSEADLFDVLL